MRARELLPWREFTVDTSWSPEVVTAAIDRECANPVQGGRPDAAFVGERTGPGVFDLRRNPRQVALVGVGLHVVVSPARARGARLRVTVGAALPWMTLGGLAAALVTVCVMLGLRAWSAASELSLGALDGVPAICIPALVAILGVFALVGGAYVDGFRHEARLVESILRSAFAEAPGVPDPPDTGEPFR
jgi:hypothetical protein